MKLIHISKDPNILQYKQTERIGGIKGDIYKMKISEIYKRYLKGEKFKSISELNLRSLPIKQAADLVGSSPIMQEIAKKHSKSLKHKKNYPL